MGAVSQSFGAFNHILSDFSLLINQFEQISAFSAGLSRLTTFIDRIDSLSTSNSSYSPRGPLINMTKLPVAELNEQLSTVTRSREGSKELLLELRNLTVITPDGSRIIVGGPPLSDGRSEAGSKVDAERDFRGAYLRVYKGDSLLVVGSSGSGKSSLVRAMAGLWQIGHGSVIWADYGRQDGSAGETDSASSEGIIAAPKYVFFLPQRSYNIIGTLREQIMYPNIKKAKKIPSTLSSTISNGSCPESFSI